MPPKKMTKATMRGKVANRRKKAKEEAHDLSQQRALLMIRWSLPTRGTRGTSRQTSLLSLQSLMGPVTMGIWRILANENPWNLLQSMHRNKSWQNSIKKTPASMIKVGVTLKTARRRIACFRKRQEP